MAKQFFFYNGNRNLKMSAKKNINFDVKNLADLPQSGHMGV